MWNDGALTVALIGASERNAHIIETATVYASPWFAFGKIMFSHPAFLGLDGAEAVALIRAGAKEIPHGALPHDKDEPAGPWGRLCGYSASTGELYTEEDIESSLAEDWNDWELPPLARAEQAAQDNPRYRDPAWLSPGLAAGVYEPMRKCAALVHECCRIAGDKPAPLPQDTLSEVLGVSQQMVSRRLAKLCRNGFLRQVKPGSKGQADEYRWEGGL